MIRRTVIAVLSLFFLLVPAAAADAAGKPERVVTPSGIEAWLIEDHLNPIISMKFEFRGGAALDPEGKDGLANMVSGLLDEGAGDIPSKAFQRELEDLAVTLRFSAGRDTFGGGLKTLKENQTRAFELLRLALTQPRFDAEPVERLRQQIMAGLRREKENPGAIAGEAIMKGFFGDHVYARRTRGGLETLKAITVEDLKTFAADRLALDNLVIGVAGDVTPSELSGLLESAFAGLPKTSKPFAVAKAEPKATGSVTVIDKAVPQSTILFGHKGVSRDDPDFFAAYVLNHILGGGGFTSRLYEEVREKRGLAYSVYSYLHPLDHAAIWMGGAGTANERVKETLDVVRAEWKRIAEKGVSDDELKDAKTFLTGSYPLQFTSTDRIASTLVAMQLDDLGVDYLEKRNGFIEAVEQDDIKRVAAKLLAPNNLTFVIVGQPEGVSTTN